MNDKSHKNEVESGERFSFGDNWSNFLKIMNDDRITEAIKSLQERLGVQDLKGKTFLDIGSGSGLFSLAARKLGAKVHSFDYDPQSVECTRKLKSFHFANDNDWIIEVGSALDKEYLKSLGEFDIVYSWGVLHHTGDMWAALDHVDVNVADGGTLFISLYNDQGGASRRWSTIKRIYNRLPSSMRGLFAFVIYLPLEIRSILIHTIRLKPMVYFDYIKNYNKYGRGMSWWHDKIDWIGGFPFEVSRPDEIFNFYKERDYVLKVLTTCGGGLGCNEYVFEKCKKTSS